MKIPVKKNLSVFNVQNIFRCSPYNMSYNDCTVIWHSCELNTAAMERQIMKAELVNERMMTEKDKKESEAWTNTYHRST